MILIKQISVGSMQNFTYIIHDSHTSKAIIVDPSWDLDKITDYISAKDLQPINIVNTHSHFDHTLGNQILSQRLRISVIQHASSGMPHNIDINEGDTVNFGDSTLQVLHTPGHSQDSICLLNDAQKIILTGDTLFVGSCGRTDLPGGDALQLYHSLQRLSKLDGTYTIYPGHNYGRTTKSTIQEQRATNLALQPRTEEEFVALLG